MKKWNAIGILTVLVIGMVLISGCTGTGSLGTAPVATPAPPVVNGAVPVTPTMTPPQSPTPTPAPVATTIQTQPARDPIIGSWLNGMDFNADGTVGGDGYTTWQVNRNQKYSYFVISDRPSPVGNNQRDVTSAEWIYNPFSDKIYRRGSSETFSREIPPSKPTTIPPLTTIQTPATAVPTSRTPVTTTTAVPTSRTPVTTTTAVPFAVEGGTGSLFIRTGGIGEGVTVYIVRAGTDVLPIKNIFDSSGNVIESQTSGYIPVGILPDGCSERVSLTPGTYIAYLPDKYGGLPEQQFFTINDNSITTIAFMGLSYRASQGGGCGG